MAVCACFQQLLENHTYNTFFNCYLVCLLYRVKLSVSLSGFPRKNIRFWVPDHQVLSSWSVQFLITCGNQFLGYHFSDSLELPTGCSFSTLKKASFRAQIAVSSFSNHWGCYLFSLSTSLWRIKVLITTKMGDFQCEW